jgi:hypothetical protein
MTNVFQFPKFSDRLDFPCKVEGCARPATTTFSECCSATCREQYFNSIGGGHMDHSLFFDKEVDDVDPTTQSHP